MYLTDYILQISRFTEQCMRFTVFPRFFVQCLFTYSSPCHCTTYAYRLPHVTIQRMLIVPPLHCKTYAYSLRNITVKLMYAFVSPASLYVNVCLQRPPHHSTTYAYSFPYITTYNVCTVSQTLLHTTYAYSLPYITTYNVCTVSHT